MEISHGLRYSHRLAHTPTFSRKRGGGSKTALLGLAALLFSFPVSANTVSSPRTQTSLISAAKVIHAGEKFWLALHIELQPGWHVYWSNAGDSGIPPQLKWTLPNGFVANPTQYLAPEREHAGPLVDYVYNKDAYYLIAMQPPPILRDGTTVILQLKASWLVCKDICIPESGDLSLALPAGPAFVPSDDAELIAKLVGRLPMPIAQTVGFRKASGEIRFSVPLKETGITGAQIKTSLFFPDADGLIINAKEQQVEIKNDAVDFAIGQAEGRISDNASGLLSLFLKDDSRRDFTLQLQSRTGAAQVAAAEHAPKVISIEPEKKQAAKESVTLASAVWYALLGGLILNAMPCVFPVLSLKALAVARKAASHPSHARKQGLAYAFGVIISFLVLAMVLVAFQKAGQVAGWGYQMQSPVFVTLLSLLLFSIALNLAGYFDLPVMLGNVGGDKAAKDNARGSFLTGILAVAVATPCTAPYMASAIGYALTQNAIAVFAVFAALGLGLASPFLLISFFPRFIKILPKPGAWMKGFKELLAFPMFGWTVWLLWVLGRETGPDVVCGVLMGMILLALGLWLGHRRARIWRLAAWLVAAAGIVLCVMAAHMPLPQTMAPNAAHAHAERFTPVRLDTLRKQGKAVFVDATADWCLICKVNETVALSSPGVMQAFKDKQIAYLVADWTYGDEAITHYLESFNHSGVPIYVFYPKDGAPVVLPQVLTPAGVLQVIQ